MTLKLIEVAKKITSSFVRSKRRRYNKSSKEESSFYFYYVRTGYPDLHTGSRALLAAILTAAPRTESECNILPLLEKQLVLSHETGSNSTDCIACMHEVKVISLAIILDGIFAHN